MLTISDYSVLLPKVFCEGSFFYWLEGLAFPVPFLLYIFPVK